MSGSSASGSGPIFMINSRWRCIRNRAATLRGGKRGEAMSGDSIGRAAVTARSAEAIMASPVPDRPAGWWRAWRDRFGLAEVCGTLAAAAGFAAGYAQVGSLLAAAALATICEAIGFYGCIAAKT